MKPKLTRAVVLLALSAAACGSRGDLDLDPSVVATIDGAPLTRDDLELYFRVNLLGEEDTEDAGSDSADWDRVKSRLLDALVEERTLLAEARRQNIQISGREIDAYLDLARSEGAGGMDLPRESRRALARQRLTIQRLQDRVAQQVAPPTDEEVLAFAGEAQGDPEARRRVLLRALLFESEETAQQVRADIRRNRTSFADAALAHESQPGQSAPTAFEWNGLSRRVRDALEDLKPGEVSPPVEYNGQTYLFQVQAWLGDAGSSEKERVLTARLELERRRRREARDQLMDELQEKTEIRLQTQHLEFRYVPEAGG